MLLFLLTHFNRCTSSGGYVRTNSTSKQVTPGCVIWTIVKTIDKNVRHKTILRTLSTGNISLFVLLLNTGPYHLLCAFSDHLFHLFTLSPCSGILNFTPSEALYAPRKKDQSADTLPVPYSKYIERSKAQIQHKYSCPQIS